jgi:hypothetical protein
VPARLSLCIAKQIPYSARTGAIGQLQQQNLFPHLEAYTLLFGYTFAF